VRFGLHAPLRQPVERGEVSFSVLPFSPATTTVACVVDGAGLSAKAVEAVASEMKIERRTQRIGMVSTSQ